MKTYVVAYTNQFNHKQTTIVTPSDNITEALVRSGFLDYDHSVKPGLHLDILYSE